MVLPTGIFHRFSDEKKYYFLYLKYNVKDKYKQLPVVRKNLLTYHFKERLNNLEVEIVSK